MRRLLMSFLICLSGCVGTTHGQNDQRGAADQDETGDDGDDNTDGGDSATDDDGHEPSDPDDGDPGPFIPPTCADGSSNTLPEGAPVLSTTQWTDVSPEGPIFDAQASSVTQGLAMDPCNPATLYTCAAIHAGGVYRTLDGGATWTELGDFNNCISVRVDPEDPLHLYVGAGVASGNDGFWVSYDGGETWAIPQGYHDVATTAGYDVYHVEPDPADFNHVLLSYHYAWNGHNDNAGVAESFDGGESWELHAPPSEFDWGYGDAILFLYEPTLGIGNSNTWLLGSQDAGYFRTSNGGESWTKVSDTVMTHGGAKRVYAPDGTLYLTASTGLMRSTDNGVTWTSLPSTGPTLGLIIDGERIFTGRHGGGPFRVAPLSNDMTWSDFSAQNFYEGPFEMAFDSVNGIIYSANIRHGVWALKVE